MWRLSIPDSTPLQERVRASDPAASAPASACVHAAPDPVCTIPGVKDELVKLRLSGEEKARWSDAARSQGLTLSDYVRRSVEQGYDLDHALELQVEDERRRREQRESVDETKPEVTPARERMRTGSRPRARPGRSIGDALDQADRNAGSRGPLL
jgi:hypothetical protein